MLRIFSIAQKIIAQLDRFSSVVDLLARLWAANVFWKSGTVKIADMDATIRLFANQYQVPILSPAVAAYASTYSEIVFSILLAFGLATRFSAFMLLCVNAVAMLSYSSLQDIAVQWHIAWGLMLLMILFHGPGKIAVDGMIKKFITRFGSQNTDGS